MTTTPVAQRERLRSKSTAQDSSRKSNASVTPGILASWLSDACVYRSCPLRSRKDCNSCTLESPRDRRIQDRSSMICRKRHQYSVVMLRSRHCARVFHACKSPQTQPAARRTRAPLVGVKATCMSPHLRFIRQPSTSQLLRRPVTSPPRP
jgi:hypothetical protein